MLGLEEFVVRSQKMKATPNLCHQAQIVVSSIFGEPKCSKPKPTLGSMLMGVCVVALDCVRVFALLLLVWSHGGRFGSSVTIRDIRVEASLPAIFPHPTPLLWQGLVTNDTCVGKTTIQLLAEWHDMCAFVPHCKPDLVSGCGLFRGTLC